MTNHVHLLMTPEHAESCTELMRDLGQRYVQSFNRRYGRTGTLWEGRFRSCLVESARYVLACHRYIELNPVRARLAERPADYPWSSYRGNAGLADDPLACPHPEFLALGQTTPSRQSAYRELFGEGLDPIFIRSIRNATYAGLPLASETLKRKLASELGRRVEPARRGRPPKKSGSDPDLENLEIGL